MKLIEHEQNRAIRLGEFSDGAPKLYGSNLVAAVKQRYGFIEAPETVAQFNLQAGIVFRHGFFQNQVIERLQVYNNGMLAEAKADTDTSDAFLDDLNAWAPNEAGITFREGESSRIYMSQLVVQTEASLPKALEVLQSIATAISMSVNAKQNLPAEVSGFHLQSDPAAGAGWNYRFERRVERPFGEHLYFSSAPLRTRAHLVLLEKMEEMFSRS